VGQARGLIGSGSSSSTSASGTAGAVGSAASSKGSSTSGVASSESSERERRQPLFVAPAERDDLKRISGIGPVMEDLLNELGVVSFSQLASFDQGDIARIDEALTDFPGRAERDDWVGQAKVLVGGSANSPTKTTAAGPASASQSSSNKSSSSNANNAKAQTSTTNTSGANSVGSSGAKDDLTAINGIGKATVKRLAKFGVKTFAHIIDMDAATIESIESSLEDGPGRIERENWVGQAKDLSKG